MRGVTRTVWLAVALLGLLSACAGQPPRHPALAGAPLTELLPVREFVANTDYVGGYRISPDGRQLAWIAVRGAAPRIFVQTLGADDARALPTFSFDFRWAADSRHLLLRKDSRGDENYHLWLIDSAPDGAAPVDLTPAGPVRVELLAVERDGNGVLIADNRRDARMFDAYRVDLSTRTTTRLTENPGDVAAWVADAAGSLAGRIRYHAERRWLELREGDAWRTVYAWGVTDSVEVLAIDAAHVRIWLRSNLGRERVALLAVNAADGRETLVHEDPQVDIGEVGISGVSGAPLFAQAHPDYPRLTVFDPALHEGMAALKRRLAGGAAQEPGIEILAADRREENFVISAYDHAGKRYYLWRRGAGTESLLGSDAIRRHGAALAPIRPIAYVSRDGLPVRGYLTLPPGAAARPLPMVLLVHGGPWARNLWADPDFREDATRVQFLANRGYVVLQVNYRGSTGYGRKFHEAARGEFAAKMQADLDDGVDWAIRAGIADPERIAIMGASYGGYATLVGLTQSPRRYACGVDIFGPADLVALLEQFPPYWQSELPMWHRLVGDPAIAAERRRLTEQSPLWQAAQVERPLLVIQGAADVRATPDQSDRMVAALRAAGKPVDYLRIDGMGHGSGHWPHKLAMYRRTEDFLARCLGGRSSGFDALELVSWAL